MRSQMVASTRNRQRHDCPACSYGCCRAYWGNKKRERRLVKRRERRAWKVEREG